MRSCAPRGSRSAEFLPPGFIFQVVRMNNRALAISILQKARDALGERLTQRVIDSESEIQDDAEGFSYLSEIEALYDQIGGRLAHVNAMLSNLPPAAAPAGADAAASEIIYADLASAYPTGLDLEAAAPLTLLALPAPAATEEPPPDALTLLLHELALHAQAGQLADAARSIAELFDVKPSQARRSAAVFARQIARDPDLAECIVKFPRMLQEASEYSAAALLGECFEFPAIEALALVGALKLRRFDADVAN